MSMNLKELIGDPGAVVAAGQKEGYPVDGELRDFIQDHGQLIEFGGGIIVSEF